MVKPRAVLSEQVVPGDVVLLSAGSLIPADGVVLEANDLFVNQAVLTGEVFPVEKKPERVAANASLTERVNCVFMGTSVRSGTARVLIVQTAKATVFGQIAERLKLRPPETEFERGVQRFGYLLTRVMLVMVVVVLAINIIRAQASFRFAALRARPGRGPDAGTLAGHHQHYALAWSAANGETRRHRA